MSDEDKIKLLYPKFQEQVVDLLYKIKNAGLVGGIFMGLRTYVEQDSLYAQGRTKPGKIITNAKSGQSYHNFGCSIDFVFLDKKGNWTWTGDYATVGKLAKECGLEWGGGWASFPDIPHIQNSYGEGDVPKKLDFIYRQNISGGAPLHAVWSYLDSKK